MTKHQNKVNRKNVVEDHLEQLGKSKQTRTSSWDHIKNWQAWLEQTQWTQENQAKVKKIKGPPTRTLWNNDLGLLELQGLGSGPKYLCVKDLIKFEKPSILLIQETKMSSKEFIKQCNSFWCNKNHLAMDARWASWSLCILWDEQELSLEHQCHTQHWIFTKIKHFHNNACY
jgi:hypothetical protein